MYRIKNYHIIIFCFILFLLSCKNIKVQSFYKNDIIKNKKICFFISIKDLFSKHLINNLKEYPYVSDYAKCDYLVVLYSKNDTMQTTNVSGINLKNQLDIDTYYYLFQFDKKLTQKAKDIFKNADIETNEKFIGRKEDFYFTKQVNQYGSMRRNIDVKQEKLDIDKTINKLKEHFNFINNRIIKQSMMYNYNILLPLSINQEMQDTTIQIAEEISQKLITNIVSDIIEYQNGNKGYENEY